MVATLCRLGLHRWVIHAPWHDLLDGLTVPDWYVGPDLTAKRCKRCGVVRALRMRTYRGGE